MKVKRIPYFLFSLLVFFFFDLGATSCVHHVIDKTEGSEVEYEKNDTVTEPELPDTLKILAIGNSFSQDAVEQYLWNLFNAEQKAVIIGNLYIGGCTLETHYKNMLSGEGKYAYRKVVDGKKTETPFFSLLSGIKDEDWDIISIQQASGKSGLYETYTPYLSSLISYIKDQAIMKDVKLAWHMTWSYSQSSNHGEFPIYESDQLKMYDAIVSSTQKALKDNHFDILIPSGTAIQNARTSYLGDSFNRDGYHLEVNYGRYTAACVWFEAISSKSAVGNSFKPETISDIEIAIAQNAAHMAVKNPFTVSDMLDFKKPYEGNPEFEDPVYIDFGAGSTMPSNQWNRITVATTNEPLYLKSKTGNWSPLIISSINGFTSTFNGVGSEPDKSININDLSFSKAVWADGLFISGTKGEGDKGPAEIVISGFEESCTYSISILAVRFNGSPSARCGEYQIFGKSSSESSKIWPGMKTWLGDDADFSPYMVTFNGLVPNSEGQLRIKVKAIDTSLACDAFVNALVVSKD